MIVRRILAIAGQTVTSAVRSRALPSLALLLLGAVVAIPLIVQSDGTLAGRIQIVIQYSAGAATAILSIATLWAASGTIASEIEDRPLFLVLSKPVSRMELWIGKWLAIAAVNLVLLAVVGVIVFGMVQRLVRQGDDSERLAVERRVLTAHQAVSPLLARDQAEVQDEVPDESEEPPPPAPQPETRSDMLAAYTVPPGRSLLLEFPVPFPNPSSARISLGYSFMSSRPERRPVICQWSFFPTNNPAHVILATNYPGRPHVIDIPAAAAGPTVKVRVTNLPTSEPSTIIFDRDAGAIELLVPRSGFGGNLVRALLIAWLRLAFVTALGVSAGCLFSLPVALFVAASFLIVLLSAGYIQHVSASGMFYVPHEGGLPEQGVVERMTLHMFRAINEVTEPLLGLDGMSLLAAGRWISDALVARAFGLLLGLYTLVTGALGVLAFRRREVGLF